MLHNTSRRLLCLPLGALTLLTGTSLSGCVPTEEPEAPPTVIIVDDDEAEVTPPEPVCGNGVVEGDEVCDDGVNDGMAGSCLADCSGEGVSTCGNGVIDDGEHCDGTLGMVSCNALGFDGGGTSQCTTSCALDVTTCTGVRRLPDVEGSSIGVSADNRFEIYQDIQLECDESTCYSDPGEPGVIYTLDLAGGDVISHGQELATISLTPIDAQRYWILADWDREDHHGQLQIRRFDGTADPVVVASRVSVDNFVNTHATHLGYVDTDGNAWVVRHGEVDPVKVYAADRWISSFVLGPDGTTALIEEDEKVAWLSLDGGRIDFDGHVSTSSADGRWAVVTPVDRVGAQVISITSGAVLKTLVRPLDAAHFSPSSNFLYMRETACSFQSRTSVMSLPDGETTTFGECARYQFHGLEHFTDDDRWLMQSRYLEEGGQNELVFTDLDTRETTVIPYRFVSDGDDNPVYAYERSSEQLIFSGVHSDGTGSRAHRLELSTGTVHALGDDFAGADAEDGGWLIARRSDPSTWTWDRYFMTPNGSSEIIARRTDWITTVSTVPGLYVVQRESTRGLFFARRGQSTLEPLSEESAWDVRVYGPYLVWRDFDGAWLTIPH